MSVETISYSPSSEGWSSRWSYTPDWMIGLNSNFYSWKDGNLYQHDTNTRRNNFYGVDHGSSITTIFNQQPLDTKLFKTVALDSTVPWTTTVNSDLEVGGIDQGYYQDKEGGWFAYIRRDNNIVDTRSLSTQGVGSLGSIASNVLTFSFKIGTTISVGDLLYKVIGGILIPIGSVDIHTVNTITVSGLVDAPSPGDLIVFTKNSMAESYGVRGYFMEIKLENSSVDDVELFSISSTVFKSNP